MPKARFVGRDELAGSEWDNQRKDWKRPGIDREVLKKLSERSTLNGLARIAYFVLLLAASAVAAVYVSRINPWLAIPVLYVYYFFYGFWVAIVHELQHKTVFARSADWLNEVFLYFVQTIVWNSPTYARISHRLHHRYTMVRGVDPGDRLAGGDHHPVAARVPAQPGPADPGGRRACSSCTAPCGCRSSGSRAGRTA